MKVLALIASGTVAMAGFLFMFVGFPFVAISTMMNRISMGCMRLAYDVLTTQDVQEGGDEQ